MGESSASRANGVGSLPPPTVQRMEARYELPCEGGQAAFADPVFPPGGGIAHAVHLDLRLRDLTVRMPLAVYADAGHTIVDFLAELASDWSGWEGGRTWYDDSVRFLMTAIHDGRRSVEFNFRARSDMAATLDDAVAGSGEWLAEATVTVAPGSLSEIHAEVRDLLHGHR